MQEVFILLWFPAAAPCVWSAPSFSGSASHPSSWPASRTKSSAKCSPSFSASEHQNLDAGIRLLVCRSWAWGPWRGTPWQACSGGPGARRCSRVRAHDADPGPGCRLCRAGAPGLRAVIGWRQQESNATRRLAVVVAASWAISQPTCSSDCPIVVSAKSLRNEARSVTGGWAMHDSPAGLRVPEAQQSVLEGCELWRNRTEMVSRMQHCYEQGKVELVLHRTRWCSPHTDRVVGAAVCWRFLGRRVLRNARLLEHVVAPQ